MFAYKKMIEMDSRSCNLSFTGMKKEPWLAEVRLLHWVLLTWTALIVFTCIYYINISTLQTTAPPMEWYLAEPNIFQGNSSHNDRTSSKAPPQIQLIYEAGHVDGSSNICTDLGKDLKVLIAIASATDRIIFREAVRQTWGSASKRKDVDIAFTLGTTSNKTINKQLDEEQELYGDLIRGKFVDTYENFTLKTISMLEWIADYCPKTAFVLKTDDNVFINIPLLLNFIGKHKPEERSIYGSLAKSWTPYRNEKSKYYVSPEAYKPSVWPDFTRGEAYLFPGNLAKQLFQAALSQTYLKLEDVFLTGIVANRLNITRVQAAKSIGSIHLASSAAQYDIWKKLHGTAEFSSNKLSKFAASYFMICFMLYIIYFTQ